ncbi:MAG: hypothetical protein EOO73_08005 [Myxococcales bacterium]|nr:MAG: hypothetical protein EOO73_08005 [Myxococcales bacterium]
MREGWLGFWRKKKGSGAADPDIAVARRQLWGMAAVVVASSAALLGTSDVDHPSGLARYEFRRDSIDGGVVRLSVDQPSATFFVNVTAIDLGPENVVSTTDAHALIEGTVEAAGLSEGQERPPVAVRVVTTNGQSAFEQPVVDSLSTKVALPFVGNCNNPQTGMACAAHFLVEVRRTDDGEAGGELTFAWHFSLSSLGQVARNGAEEDVSLGPVEPPWTVEVTEP